MAGAGAVADAFNAVLCLARIPEPVDGGLHFSWPIVPAGGFRGAVLAVIPVAVAVGVSQWRPVLRLLTVPVVGWVAGYVSWIPLERWGVGQSWPASLLWLFREAEGFAIAFGPFQFFGLVSALYLLLLTYAGLDRGRGAHVAYGVCAGVLGSLWWWSQIEPWYFAIIHGLIWGVLVGLATHAAFKTQVAAKEVVE